MNTERFDQLLGEYFEWSDGNIAIDAAPTNVEAFLRDCSHWRAEPQLVARLHDFLDDSRDIQRVAAATLSQWITDDVSSTGAVLSDEELAKLPREIGDYELLEEIGRGGMGVVYRAHQKSLDRVVCAKMILAGKLAGPRDVERFVAEARAMAALHHQNIVAVYEVNSHDDQHFYTMEFVPGETLASMVKGGPLTAEQAATFASQVANAIAFAHEQGVLHRDLKPSNVIVDRSSVPRVMDFGLSRGLETGNLTSTGALVGTPSYMAPELTKGDCSAGVACDVYGLGAVLYELITARPPFQGETPLDTLLQVRENEPVRPSLLNPRVPTDLETICLKCLNKNPDQRYANATTVAAELGRFLRREPIVARPLSQLARFSGWCRRNPLPVALAATVITALLAISAVLLYSNQQQAKAYNSLQTQKNDLADAKRKTDKANERLEQERNRLTQTQERLSDYLLLSRIRRASQAVNHGDIAEVDELLRELEPREGASDRRGWEWHYLRAISHQYETLANFDTAIRDVVEVGGHHVLALDATGTLWLVDANEQRHSLVEVPAAHSHMAWNESTRQLAIGLNNGTVQIIHLDDPDDMNGNFGSLANETIQWETGSRRAVRAVAWSHSGNRLACGLDDGTLAIIDSTLKKLLDGQPVHTDGINSISWSHDSQWVATGSDDFMIKVVAPDDLGRSVEVARFADWANDVAFAPGDLTLAAVSQSGQFQLWDLRVSRDQLSARLQFGRATARGESLSSVSWSDDGSQVATAGDAAELSVWSAETGHRLRKLYGHRQHVQTLDWRDESLISASADGDVKRWDTSWTPDGQVIAEGDSPIRYAVWHPQLPLAAWRDVEGVITVWDNENRRVPTRFTESVSSATALAWHPTEPFLALSRDESVLIYDLQDDTKLIQLDQKEGKSVWLIRWSPTGKMLATTGAEGKVAFWSFPDANRLSMPDALRDVSSYCWSSDGNRVYLVDNAGQVLSIDILEADRTARRIGSIGAHLAKSIAVSPTDSQLAIATESGEIVVLPISDPTAGQSTDSFSLQGHQGPAWSCVWASSGRRLVSGGQDGTIRVWHINARQEALRIPAHESAVWSLSLRANQLISASADGTVRLWSAP